ncbi:MAG: DUF4402 domain-containing protein [Pseudomonadota bacterium]
MRVLVGMVRAAFGVTAMGLVCSLGATAQTDSSGQTGADIIQPLMVKAWEELEFGTIIPNTLTSGIVSISVDETRTCTAELICTNAVFSAARFMVTGEPDKIYEITIPPGLTMENSSGDQMLVDGLHSDIDQGLLIDGTDEFWVGADLHVSANQALGTYTGTYTVSVEYQ